MHSDDGAAAPGSPAAVGRSDVLSAVTAGAADAVSDAVVVARLVDAEAALMRAWAVVGAAPAEVAEAADALSADPGTIEEAAKPAMK